jgi:hypothetical protein
MDYFRRAPFSTGGPRGHKEWHHFCILAPHVDLLVNFSLAEDVGSGARDRTELPRLTVLVRDASWDGDVDVFDPQDIHVAGGQIDTHFGRNRLQFHDGAYRISFALQDRPISGELALRPLTFPALAPNIPLPEGPPLHWVIVPRLSASGHVTVAGHQHRFNQVPAYHDHNFGHFLWGHAFSWIWGFCLPSQAAAPWSFAFVRLSNRSRTCALAQGLFLWRGPHISRVFREDDLELRMSLQTLQPERVFKIPRAMALLSPEGQPDVPEVVELHADADGDSLDLRFAAQDLAQVVIPSETDLSVTIINEVTGRASVHGRIRGESIDVDGRTICEFLSV